MNMEHLLLSCIESRVENNGSLYGRFQLGPFDKSQGLTIANAIRRTLLSELSGLAILCVEIQGVSHEYSNLKGIRESVLDILLNLKQIVFITNKKFNQPEIGFLKIQGPAIIKACDLKLPPFIQCVDPNQHIATLSDNGVLEMKFMICEGKNFLVQTPSKLIQECFQSHFQNKKQTQHYPSEQISSNFDDTILNNSYENKLYPQSFETLLSENNDNNNKVKNNFLENQTNFQKFEKDLMLHKQKIAKSQSICNMFEKQDLKKKTFTNLLFIDAVFMPIKKVNFSIQNVNNYYKVKQSSLISKLEKNYSQEKIILEIWTNGSIHPKKAIYEAVQKILDILIPLQKTYFYKKTKLAVRPIISKRSVFHSSLASENNRYIFTTPEQNFNVTKTRNFLPDLNKIYRPWSNCIQFKSVQNYFLIKQKKTLKYKTFIDINKNFKSNKSIVNQLKFLDISYLNLPFKSYICLKRANINMIQNLLSYSRNELLLIKNLGEKSVKKIEIVLAKKNFTLRSET